MYKRTVATFFTILFMGLITAPSVIIVLDDSFDTSIFYSITEEEENGKSKKIMSALSLQANDILTDFTLKNHQFFSFRFKTYPKPHLNLISPPPELYIL
jgi:hypothetical protein